MSPLIADVHREAFRRAVTQAREMTQVITFASHLHGRSFRERQAEYRAACAIAQALAAQGHLICVADLLALARQVYTSTQEVS